MHFTIPLLCLLSTGALALPSSMESKRQSQPIDYNGPLGAAGACPTLDHDVLSLSTDTQVFGAPPNYPNYACIKMSTTVDWIGINLFLSNSTALVVYSDQQCMNRISFIEEPQSLGNVNQFCAQQSQNGGIGSWQSVMYAEP